jgi:Zn-dependent M28 family amino/carboxypeptidase
LLGRTVLGGRIELVAFTLEESPFFRSPDMGSARHAELLKSQGADVRAVIALEMVGFYSDAPGSQSYPSKALEGIYPDKGSFIAVVGRIGQEELVTGVCAAMASAGDLPVYQLAAPPGMRGVDFSDHASYWAEGFPAVMITDTAFYRNPNYHRPTDTPETLDYERMGAVVKQVYSAVLRLAR